MSESVCNVTFNYSGENCPGPTDLVNKYVTGNCDSDILQNKFIYNDSRKNQGNLHTLLRLKQRTQGT